LKIFHQEVCVKSKIRQIFAVLVMVLLCLILVVPLGLPAFGLPATGQAPQLVALMAGVFLAGIAIGRPMFMRVRRVKTLLKRSFGRFSFYASRGGMVAWLNRVIKIPMPLGT
jgi:hypothetical protein